MNGTSLTDIANSTIAELKEEGIEPTLENITDRLNKHINLSEWAGCNGGLCRNCDEYENCRFAPDLEYMRGKEE